MTKPGLQVKVGRPAINPGPQIMLRYVYEELIGKDHGCIVTVSIPKGEELAKQTLNPSLGIVGGISVLGTTGIVKPMSEEAYKIAGAAGAGGLCERDPHGGPLSRPYR